jgi:hypothetical protein
VAIDNRLFSLMKKHMPDAFGHLNHLIAPGSIFMDSFEKLKRDFDEGLPYHCFKLPLQVRRGRATCDPRYYNSSAFEFYLRYDDVRSLFDPVIFNIIRLINSQIKVANLEYGSPVINVCAHGLYSDQTAHNCTPENCPCRRSRIFDLRSKSNPPGFGIIAEAMCDGTHGD